MATPVAAAGYSPGYGRLKLSYPILREKITGMYKCTLCAYKSLHRSSVRSHYAVHSNARPYACDMCEYEAKRLTDLKKHQVLRHGKDLNMLRLQGRKSYPPLARSTIITETEPETPVTQNTSQNNPTTLENIDPDEHINHIDAMLDYHAKLDSSYNQNGCMDIPPTEETAGETASQTSFNENNFENLKLDELSHLSANNAGVKQEPMEQREGGSDGGEGASAAPPNPPEYAAQLPPNNSDFAAHLPPEFAAWAAKQQQPRQTTATGPKKSWHCEHCNITYYDSAMYVMHTGLHNSEHPWKCNLCGRQFHDVYGFTSHFVNGHAAHRD
ncbi:hypothetical protein CAPTEDRAFT_226562 [Capitella teleta]|uniref:C2H2-type domain-containing protein n=1 Tax=Capitella teleta TaxID=283909 RepID=R7TZA2_CAPTE|nr:hypothetical protein CAPTEDRAFT_226562 [Capitella teleta]|eukprot:ELT96260.1 hypothetical protein CAPTEDRAFT_226562 [Capitella teleta]